MSDVIYTAEDGKQYKAVSVGSGSCSVCALNSKQNYCAESRGTLDCCAADIIWQPITIQKPADNFHQWLQENAEMFRPIFERMKEKE